MWEIKHLTEYLTRIEKRVSNLSPERENDFVKRDSDEPAILENDLTDLYKYHLILRRIKI